MLLSLGACGGEGKRPESAGPNGEGEQGAAKNAGEVSAPAVPERPAKRDIRVATYNAGLAVGVLKYADERAAMVAQTLAKEDVDLLCVQEVWLEDLGVGQNARPGRARVHPERLRSSPRARGG